MKCERCGKINPAEIHTCTPEPQVNGWPLYSGLPKLIKLTQEQVMAWAQKYGDWNGQTVEMNDVGLEAAYAAAYEAGRKDENEACAVEVAAIDADGWEFNMAAIIRARREQ